MDNDKIRSFKYPDAVIEAMVENYIPFFKANLELAFGKHKNEISDHFYRTISESFQFLGWITAWQLLRRGN